MKPHRLFPFLLILIIVCSSCHVTRHLKDGEYMLTKNVVKTDLKDPQFDDLYYYVRPTPNKKFIDIIPFKTWSYVAFQPKVIYTADGDSIVKDSKFRQRSATKEKRQCYSTLPPSITRSTSSNWPCYNADISMPMLPLLSNSKKRNSTR